ncbi:MAG: metal ABC transporter substrate-binding protein [Planctomycetota bacterium]
MRGRLSMSHNLAGGVAGFLMLAVSCLSFAGEQGEGRRLKVITTLEILRELAQAVGGDRVEAVALADPGQDPHYVQPRPTLMKRCREADLFIEVGLELELWAQRVIDGAGNPRIQVGQPGRVIASRGIRTIGLPARVTRAEGDIHPSGNPHLWLDPLNIPRLAANIAAGLAAVDPGHADRYRARLAGLEGKLATWLFGLELVKRVGARKLLRDARRGRLESYLQRNGIEEMLGGWLRRAAPLRARPLVTYHRNWGYLARRLGMEVVMEIEEKPGIPPSAKHRDLVIRTIRERAIPAILMASHHDGGAGRFIGRKSGARLIVAPMQPGGEEGVRDYFELMETLIDRLLGGEAP